MRDTRWKSDLKYVLIASVAGLLIGFVGTLFHLGADALLKTHKTLFADLAWWPAILGSAALSAVMVLVATLLVRRFAPEAAGSGVHEIEGALESARPTHWRRVLPVKFVGGVLAIGSGLVVGREGPTIHIGASISAGLSQLFRCGEIDRNGLVAAGAAAGLAAAFNAPVAAVLFVIEETRRQFPYTFWTYTGVMFASIGATVVTEYIAGVGPDLKVEVATTPLYMLVAFIGLGVVMGLVGVAFNASLVAALDRVDTIHARHPYLAPIAVGALIGACMVVIPEVTEGGEGLIPKMLASTYAVPVLAAIVAMRYLTTLLSYSIGAPGGIFAPLLALATVFGLLFHALLTAAWPEGFGPHGVAFAVAAMAGIFASSVRAPMVGVVLVAELTQGYDVLLPVLLTAAVSHLVAQVLGGQPIYETLLNRVLKRDGAKGAAKPDEDRVPLELGPSPGAGEAGSPPGKDGAA